MKKVIVIDYVNQGVVIKLIDESDYLILKDKTDKLSGFRYDVLANVVWEDGLECIEKYLDEHPDNVFLDIFDKKCETIKSISFCQLLKID